MGITFSLRRSAFIHLRQEALHPTVGVATEVYRQQRKELFKLLMTPSTLPHEALQRREEALEMLFSSYRQEHREVGRCPHPCLIS